MSVPSASRAPRASGRHAPARKPAPGLAARAVALDVLDAVLDRGRPMNEALERHAGWRLLPSRDRALARTLVATTLRRLGQIDAAIGALVPRPPPRTARSILRLGTCQLLFLSTPAHAAVDTTVALAKARGAARFAGLVNAALRRLGADPKAALAGQDAARLDTPDWLWRSWSEAFGEAVCRRIAEAHLGEPPLDLSVKSDPEGWAGRLGGRVLATGSVRVLAQGPVAALPGFAEGAWWVQDAAAALPAALLGSLAGRRVIDLCAAPGGKTAQLANAGARVIAVERSESRLALVAENLARLRLSAELVAADALTWRPEQPADAVLLDAPCTATGTIRRHPDVRWLKRPEDVEPLALLQERLLSAAVGMVRPGGLVVYCVCSLEARECETVIARVLAAGAPVARAPVGAAEVGGLAELIGPDGDLRTLPCHLEREGGMDGFFACRLRRL